MFGIPRIVLFFGSLGLLPFVAGVLISSGGFYADMGDPNDGGYSLIITKDGLDILVDYGKIILTFSSGVLLGFAAKTNGPIDITGYSISTLPVIYVFLNMGDTHQTALINLMWSYGGLALLDIFFFRQKLTPPWWLRFRIPLTLIVIICLGIGAHT